MKLLTALVLLLLQFTCAGIASVEGSGNIEAVVFDPADPGVPKIPLGPISSHVFRDVAARHEQYGHKHETLKGVSMADVYIGKDAYRFNGASLISKTGDTYVLTPDSRFKILWNLVSEHYSKKQYHIGEPEWRSVLAQWENALAAGEADRTR